ncbi:PREDICTED: neuropeptide FF receptor 2-like [Acropora digitifera]|uniref:neuropeptide FF receptor 2-like n=1 Tax=Acropora digitifera TaxID=70779 RepID=UPI00077AE5A4|nr:PREDICTED: neuropeptide FF receptor 2-like [Acropora digitifera]
MDTWMETANSSQNSTETKDLNGSKALIILQLLFYFSIIVVGSIGNALICLTILGRKERKTSEYFILNLAITDLATSVISIPLDIIERLAGYWPFGSFLCKVVYPLQTILMAVSVSTLLAMSLERHRAIIHPLKPRMKGKKPIITILVIWLASTFLVFPYIFVLGLVDVSCVEKWPNTHYAKAYTISVFIVLYLCPLAGITIAYARIGRKLYRDIKKIRMVVADSERGLIGKQVLRNRAHRNVRIVKIFVTAVIAFGLCMLPNHIVWLWHDYGDGSGSKYFSDVLVFANILVYVNSSINPFIFGTLQARCASGCKGFFGGSTQGKDDSGSELQKRMFSIRVSFTSSSKLGNYIRGTLRRPSHSFRSIVQRPGTGTRNTIKEQNGIDCDNEEECDL